MLRQQSAHSFLSEITKRHIPVIEVTMTAINAPKWLATRLGVKRGAAVLVRGNCFRDWRETIVQYGLSYFPGHLQMEYVLGRSAKKGVKRGKRQEPLDVDPVVTNSLAIQEADRKGAVEGKRVSVRVNFGGRRRINKKKRK